MTTARTNCLFRRRDQLLTELSALRGREAMLTYLIGYGRQLPALPCDLQTDAFAVPGCIAQLWLVAELRGGCCEFRCESDSQIVKGVAGLICTFYSGATPRQILDVDPSFLRDAGLTAHLTANRRNSLAHIWRVIRTFAETHTGQDAAP